MTYEEAVAKGLGPYIAKPGEKLTPISDVTNTDLQKRSVIPNELLEQWALNDIGEAVILDKD